MDEERKKEDSQGGEEDEQISLGEVIERYRELFISTLGGDPLKFGDHTPREIELMIKGKEGEWKTRMEEKAWLISWLTAPHVKRAIKPQKIFDYDRIKRDEEKEDEEKFIEMFMSEEELAKKTSETITQKLIEINERKKLKDGNENPISQA